MTLNAKRRFSSKATNPPPGGRRLRCFRSPLGVAAASRALRDVLLLLAGLPGVLLPFAAVAGVFALAAVELVVALPTVEDVLALGAVELVFPVPAVEVVL